MEKKIILDGREVSGDLRTDGKRIEISLKDQVFSFEVVTRQGNLFILKGRQNILHRLHIYKTANGQVLVDFEGRTHLIEEGQGRVARAKNVDLRPRAPMPGKIMKILKKKGDLVKKGDPLIIMEAMKMEHTIRAGADAIIKEIFCTQGELVSGGMDLLSFEIKTEGESKK